MGVNSAMDKSSIPSRGSSLEVPSCPQEWGGGGGGGTRYYGLCREAPPKRVGKTAIILWYLN